MLVLIVECLFSVTLLTGSPLWFAATAVSRGDAGSLDLARQLVENGADVNCVGRCVNGGGNVNAVGRCLRNELDELESTPLIFAARAVYEGREGGLELAQLLVEEGADVNAEGRHQAGGLFIENSNAERSTANLTFVSVDFVLQLFFQTREIGSWCKYSSTVV